MPRQPSPLLVLSAIMLAAGIYATLLGHRVLGRRPGLSFAYDAWHDRHGHRLRRLGPLLILAALLIALGSSGG
jgi:hypothetical protein